MLFVVLLLGLRRKRWMTLYGERRTLLIAVPWPQNFKLGSPDSSVPNTKAPCPFKSGYKVKISLGQQVSATAQTLHLNQKFKLPDWPC